MNDGLPFRFGVIGGESVVVGTTRKNTRNYTTS